MRQGPITVLVFLAYCCWNVLARGRSLGDDYDDDDTQVFNYNKYLQSPYKTKVNSKSKVETLGGVLKSHIHQLKNTKNKEFDIVFLVDSSTSVGKENFKEEIKFVKKLLSDFTVDVNHTRVSVITFSSRDRVIRHVDYLADTHKDRHKCSLLEKDLKGITYSGGGTYTLGAFREAKKVFQNSRPTANKAIFLVTDGFSNGGDPSKEARSFRQQGVKIFTFGIQNGNIAELFEMASKPKNESCYILDSFEEFEALARRALHEDLYSGRYIEQPNKRCDRLCVGKKCCDTLATCNCGSHTGQYECICPSGYFGNGLRGGCQACPSGTYKPNMKPGDDYTCLKCPDKKHITEPGATSVEQCTCQKGYRTFNGTGCAVLKCPLLPMPKNGYFVNDKCKNVFNAACGLRCKPGFDLRGSSLRICREDGTWSGITTECIMKTCPALMTPKNGNMICTTDDFTFSTVCRFTCDTGYKLVGSRKRTCLAIAFWTGINTRCREITCRPLAIVRDGSIHPPACTAGDVAFGTTCSVTCSPGYTLIGQHSKQCLPEGVWTPATDINECVDTSPPFIMCPYNIEVDADDNENTGTVSWQVPLAVDNSGYIPVLTSVPAVLPPAQFPIGKTKVTYEAEDLNKNKASCQFYVVVKDKQRPTVDRCFSPLPIVSPEMYAEVTWDEPEFSDNSEQEVRVQRSHSPGLFPRGRSEVVYTVFDDAGNSNNCTLKINVIPHPCEYPPVPLNGNRTCYETSEGVICKFTCKPGHRFAIEPAEEYLCAYDNVWQPQKKMPVSDCSAMQLSKRIEQPASFTFAGKVACQHRPGLVRLEKNFEHRIGKRIDQLCRIGLICGISDMETACTQLGDTSIHVILGRDKRSLATRKLLHRRRRASEFTENVTETVPIGDDAVVKFTYLLTGTVDPNAQITPDKAIKQQEKLVGSVEDIATALKKDAKNGDFGLHVNGNQLKLVNMTVDNKPKFSCDLGRVKVDKSCVKCPVGTFFNVVSLKCESCGKGTFQTQDGQVSCMVCPTNTSTLEQHSISQANCTALCLPGSFSYNGLEMCETCKKGFYQSQYGMKECKRCPRRHTTRKRGSRRPSDCKEKCKAGYLSKFGFEPCYPCPVGQYQPRIGKQSCIECPGKVPTPTAGATNISFCELELSDSPQNDEGFDFFGGQEQEQNILVDECTSAPCKNGATCVSRLFTFECKCVDGFKGFVCEVDIDECENNPCLNGGTCTNLLANYRCFCPPGYTGKKCEVNIDDCEPDTCLNGGTCVDEVLGISCSCPNGFIGLKCETNEDNCKADSCLNGGTCTDGIADYSCTCPAGIRGDNCEINDDDCASGPCQNNAECIDEQGGYKCVCPVGYEGTDCEVDIDECAVSPCGLNAKCEDLPGSYKCHCPVGYTGVSCKEVIDRYFQLDFPATASTVDYAKVNVEKDLTAATVCFWMKTNDQDNQGTPFSYATSDGDNVFTLSDYEGFVLYVNGDKITTTVKANDGRWHHICVMWSTNRGTWKIYMDGWPEDDGVNLASGQTVKGGGILVIGQEQDVKGGDFSKPETFIGMLTQFDMWSKELSLTEIERLRVSCDEPQGDTVAWTDIAGQVHGAVSESPVEFCKECPIPRDIQHGSVKYDGLKAGSTATYTCNRGFVTNDSEDRLCLVNGEWEGNEPVCDKVRCRYLFPKEHQRIIGSVYTFDNRVRFTCDRGFRLVGDETLYCGEEGRWVGEEPSCEPIKCIVDVLSENTVLSNPTSDRKYLPRKTALFECKPGHNFYTAHTSVVCQRDGTWDQSIPTCDPQQCQLPPPIDKGFFDDPDGATEFPVGHIAQYECDFGYLFSRNSLNPLGQLTCQASGLWGTDLPECREADCGKPKTIANGKFLVDGTTFLSQVNYECDIGYELTHTDVVECYETGFWSPSAPDCFPVTCNRPDDILHGYFNGDVYTYRSVVTYHCDLGYKIVGVETRECLANASWSGDLPVCKPISCGKPDPILNGKIIGRDYTLNNEIRYACDAGFRLDGSEKRVCRETTKWSNVAPLCLRIECGVPPSVEHGYYLETSFQFEDNITYICDSGYFLKGGATMSCQSSKLWFPAPPVCQEIKCSVPKAINNGYFLNPDGSTAFSIGHRVQYRCNLGYEISINSLNPIGQVECLGTGHWETNFPECSIIQCSYPVPITYGNFTLHSRDYLGTVTYSCDTKYQLNGDATLTCQADGSWLGVLPWCTAITCEAPSYVRNGNVTYKDLTLGSVVRYMCHEGYTIVGIDVRRCLANLSWSGEEPFCQAISCGPAEDIAHGTKQADGETFQSTVTYNCNYGYNLVGDRTRLCTKDGIWSDALPVCEIVQCDKPSFIISNGRIKGDIFTTFGSEIEYVCDEGYYIDGPLSNKRRCLATGLWDRPIPVCVAVDCPRLTVLNGFTSGFQTEYGTTITVTCKSNYRLEGASERTCQQDGTWSGKQSICVRYSCPRLNTPVNGQVFVRGVDATYLCLEGFQINGPSTRTCQADDTWSGSDPTCDAIMCEDITKTPFQNGVQTYDALVYGSSIVYECNTGYVLKGNRKLECQANGEWDGEVPLCEIKSCYAPYQPYNSEIIGTDYRFGSVITFKCHEGYLMTGNAERTCLADGSWSGKAVTCDYIVCPRPEAGANVNIVGTTYTYNSTIQISCNSGYKLIGPKVRICSQTGHWSGDEPRCERSECPQPPPLKHGRIIAASYDQGSRIQYQCNEGYKLPGLNFRLCLSTLQWSGTDPYCRKISCGAPPPLDNGVFTGDDWQYEGTVIYSCDTGYDLVGDNRRRCLSVGQWGGADPSCIRTSCGPPRLPKNAIYTLPDGADSGNFEMKADLSCEEGYAGIGTNFQVCQADGQWSEAEFECQIVTCAEYPGLRNGRFSSLGTVFGDTIDITCDDGYRLVGNKKGRCSASGNWEFEVEPYCEEITCPELPAFSNGKFDYEGSLAIGQTVVYRCDEGYKLQGDKKRFCQTDGRWGGADPYCSLIICRTPPYVSNAVPIDSTTQYFFKSEARYACNKGYSISQGDSVLTCSETGEWDGSIPICSLIQCGIPEQIANGRISVDSHNYESKAFYECNTGYRIKGSPAIICDENGKWAGTTPACVPISCGAPPQVPNSHLLTSDENIYNSQVTYICEAGYKLIGQQTTTCLATGVWSGTPPVCQPRSCGPPPDIKFATHKGSNYEINSTVVYSCNWGYEMTGNPTLRCMLTEKWSVYWPVCHQISCGPPPVLPNSVTTTSSSSGVGSVATFECNDGYYLVGSATASCATNKQWEYEDSLPVCLKKDCGPPEDVAKGQVAYTQTTFEAKATYTCSKGYFIKGQAIRTCDDTGRWSGNVPSCVPVSCGRPALNPHVQMTATRFLFGDFVQYSCDAGYKLSGDHRHECLADGSWSAAFPFCNRIKCTPLSDPLHGTLILPVGNDGNVYSGQHVTFDCDKDYKLIGSADLECLDSGLWSDSVPKCEFNGTVRCSEHTGIPNVQDLDGPYPLGGIADLICSPGFSSNVVMQTTCQADQSWSEPTGYCSRISCGKPTLRDFVNVVRIWGASYLYEDKIEFRCRAGVMPARSPPVITCKADGSWDGDIRCGVTCKQPCKNGGICLGLNRCKCPGGYGGRLCQKAVCVLPCLNGGKCVQPYKCSCSPGYGGARCNKAICKKPCQHGGRCVSPNRCKCARGFKGAFCDLKRI